MRSTIWEKKVTLTARYFSHVYLNCKKMLSLYNPVFIAAAAREPEATEQGSNSNRHRNILMGPCESSLAKCKGLWSRKDQRKKELWLILWAPQCKALLCFFKFRTEQGREMKVSIFRRFECP